MDKITIERQMLLPCPFCGDDGDKGRQEVTQMIEGRNKFARITCRACGAMCPEENWNLRAALAAQPAEPSMRPLPDHDNHHNALKCPYCNPRGLKFAEPAAAQPTGQSPCARHCEAPAFEGEIRRLKREATIKDSLTIRPPAPAAVPPGYALVPIEPTHGMLSALTQEWHPSKHGPMKQRYRAMIAAAGDKP